MTAPSRLPEPGASDDDAFAPASGEAVVARAAALFALWCRADAERGDSTSSARLRSVLARIGELGALEPEEERVLRAPLGQLSREAVVRSSWRLEGAAVLVWAVSRMELLPPDELASEDDVGRALGWYDGVAASATRDAHRKSEEELRWCVARARVIHWRLLEFRLRRRAINFRVVSERLGLGNPDLLGVPLLDGDLAVHGAPLPAATPEQAHLLLAAASERHMAASWLLHAVTPYAHAAVNT